MPRLALLFAVLGVSGKVLKAPQPPAAAVKPVRSLQSAEASNLDASLPADCADGTGNTCITIANTPTGTCPSCASVPTGTGCNADGATNPTSCTSCTTKIALPAGPTTTQTDTYTVVATFSAANVQSVWLTDSYGTVIGFASGGAITSGSTTFDVSPAALATNVGANADAQLPSSFTAHARYATGSGCGTVTGATTLSWNGILNTVVASAEFCCNALPDDGDADSAARMVTLALSSTYAAKQVTLSVDRGGSSCAKSAACLASGACTVSDGCDVPLAYISADDVPIYYKEFLSSDSTAVDTVASVSFPPTTTKLRACAAVRGGEWLANAEAVKGEGNPSMSINWYCYDLPVAGDFASEMESTSATTATALADASLSFAGIVTARPSALCASKDDGEYALYARYAGSTDVQALGLGSPIGFAAPASGSVEVYACCGSASSPSASPVNSAGNQVSCAGELSMQTFALATLTADRKPAAGGGLSQVSVLQAGNTFNSAFDAPPAEQGTDDGSGGGLSDTEIAAVVATVCTLAIALLLVGTFVYMRQRAAKARQTYKGVRLATFTRDVETAGAARATPPPPPPQQLSTTTPRAGSEAPPAAGSTEWVAGSGGTRA